ncbi:MAG TPA: DUF2399 domain-containing protein [Leucothrix mucor]|nr:DUF2399 domain-containing protein [Leucothrix mucor]
MITPTQIHQKAQKLWDSGLALEAELKNEPLFPWHITFRKPTPQQQIEKFSEVRQWVSDLKSHAKHVDKGGYEIEYKTINHRQLGEQQLPSKIVFSSRDDLLRYLGKLRQFESLLKTAQQSVKKFPVLKLWFEDKPRSFMKYSSVWSELLAVCDYFLENPRPDCYLRELEIRGVDSKFIEKHKAILAELLDQILAPETINHNITSLKQHGFERRYGLKFEQSLIRFRLLDQSLYPIAHISDISLPLPQLAQWKIPCWRVFITENKINGLSFPPMQDSLVIFGLGYGVDQLADIPWLSDCELYYWGDIDTHGFSILSRLRHHFPKAHSLMMDENTLKQYDSLCANEPQNARCKHQLKYLKPVEQQLYQHLQKTHQRLEQERLPMTYVKTRLRYC